MVFSLVLAKIPIITMNCDNRPNHTYKFNKSWDVLLNSSLSNWYLIHTLKLLLHSLFRCSFYLLYPKTIALVCSFIISWLIQGYHSSMLEWNHFSTSNESMVLPRVPNIKSSHLLGLFRANGLGLLSVQVLCLANNHKNNQGTEHAQLGAGTGKNVRKPCARKCRVDFIQDIFILHSFRYTIVSLNLNLGIIYNVWCGLNGDIFHYLDVK